MLMVASEANSVASFLSLGKETMLRFGASVPPFTMDGQWWRLFTARFLTSSPAFLPVFLWPLYVAAKQTERSFGTVEMLLIFIGSAVCTTLAGLAFSPPDRMTVGSVGPTLALAATWLCSNLAGPDDNQPSARWRWWICSFGLLALFLAFGAFVGSLDYPSLVAGTAFGAITGIMFAIAKKLQWKMPLARSITIAVVTALFAIAFTSQLSAPPYFASDSKKVRLAINWFNQESAYLVDAQLALIKTFDARTMTESDVENTLAPLRARWQTLGNQLSEAAKYPTVPDAKAVAIAAQHVTTNLNLIDSLVYAARLKNNLDHKGAEAQILALSAEAKAKIYLSAPTVHKDLVPLLQAMMSIQDAFRDMEPGNRAGTLKPERGLELVAALNARSVTLEEEAAALRLRLPATEESRLTAIQELAQAYQKLGELSTDFYKMQISLAENTAQLEERRKSEKRQTDAYNRQVEEDLRKIK